MNYQNQNGDPKPGFGETNDPQNHREPGNSDKGTPEDKEKTVEDKKKERRDSIEDASNNNYGNIGIEGGVEDLYEDD